MEITMDASVKFVTYNGVNSSYWADAASGGFPSEVKSFDLYITTFLWRQSTQHEGVMPVAPKWAGMSSYDGVMSLITIVNGKQIYSKNKTVCSTKYGIECV